ncbi:MAG: pirin family protein [Alistipes sp.]
MDMLLHKAATRGYFDHGWLRTHHTFSFADYYDPARLNFGALRVLNDDTVVPGAGFGMHPHREMEVVSIPLNRGSSTRTARAPDVIRAGGSQAMSAGTILTASTTRAARADSFCKYGFSRTVGASSP